MKVKFSQVREIIAVAFSGVRTRTVSVEDRGFVFITNLNWCEGSKSEFVAVSLADTKPGGSTAKYSMMAPWEHHAEGKCIDIPAGAVLVELAHHGERKFLYIHANPADMPRLLAGK